MSRLAGPVEGLATEYVTVAAGTLAVLRSPASDAASGPGEQFPVFCLPGYTGSKEDFGPLLAPLAAAGYPVLALDLRGQYQSAGPPDPARYQVDDLAADVLGLLDAEGLGGAHLVGHSFGGLVARAAALARPAAARSLVLLGSGPAALGGVRSQAISALAPLLAQYGQQRVWEMVGEQLGGSAFSRDRFLGTQQAALLGMATALLSEPDRTAELARLAGAGLPVLVAHGEDDDAWPAAAQREMARRLGAHYRVIPAAGHSPAVENPVATTAALVDFWRTTVSR